jgi:N-acyl-D-aspartate/D-glutamate deacylase
MPGSLPPSWACLNTPNEEKCIVAYDVVIAGGRIVDGTGRPAFDGDVAIEDGRIVALGAVDGPAVRTIDATGHVVAPGFIDAHTHYDAQLLWDPTANPSTAHGITTVLTGNCGYTLAPVKTDDQDYLMGLFAAAEEIPKKALQMFGPLVWETFSEYLDAMEGHLGVNVLAQIGHSAVRRYVMGAAALERAANPDEVAAMVEIVEAAIDAGAAGLSSSQAPHQRGELGEHIPSFYADRAETHALAEALGRKGARLLSINPASKREGINDEDQKLLVELAELSGAVVSWNDFGMGTPNGDAVLEFMEAEVARDREIYAVARCQRAETRFTLKKLSAVFASSEAWVDLSKLDPVDKLAALADAGWRARLEEFWDTAKFMVNASVEKTATPDMMALEGQLLVDIAKERGTTPAEVMFDVAIADHLETSFRITGPVTVDESRLERILKSPATLVGISDGGAHLQTFAGGDYTSYFLAHWVREKGSFTLEEGVAALSSRVAEFLGLTDRGILEVGKAADVVVFDPDTVEPLTLQTLDDIPGGGTRMTKAARGIPYVLVNGEAVVDAGTATSAIPGVVLGRG